MTKFISGLELSRLYYKKEIKPILDNNFPSLKYAAALIGWGSEVLGFDTAQSRDHHWGPRVILFLSEKDFSKLSEKINKTLSEKLPYEFLGCSTNFSKPESNGVRRPEKIKTGPVDHMVDIFTVKSFIKLRLEFNSDKNIKNIDWLTFPQQRLLEIVSGAVYFDNLKELSKIRSKFAYYPKDIWLYLLASQWMKISQEEAFVGRTGEVGDELGSQNVAARLVREIMKLCFLMEKKYYPYSKWFGTAFSKLKIAKQLSPILKNVMIAKTWKQREKELSKAYTIVANKHNSLHITKILDAKTSYYYGRPYLVIHADRFATVIRERIQDKEIKAIKLIGSVDQFTDSVDISNDLGLRQNLGTVYSSL